LGESRPKRGEIVQSIQDTEGWLKRNTLAEGAPEDAQLELGIQEMKDGGVGADLEAVPQCNGPQGEEGFSGCR